MNDHTPDPALGEYLRETAAAHDWTLIENAGNLGFAGSVNRGMGLHPERDVVVLNNDTEVANDWLDRLAEAAYAETSGQAPEPGQKRRQNGRKRQATDDKKRSSVVQGAPGPSLRSPTTRPSAVIPSPGSRTGYRRGSRSGNWMASSGR